MRYLALALTLALTFAACQSAEQNKSTETTTEESSEIVGIAMGDYMSYGAEITDETPMSLASIVADADNYIDQSVKIEGTVRKVCQSSGCWMTLDAGNGENIRITFKDYGFFVPKDIADRNVILDGHVSRDTVTVDMLRHFAEDEGLSQEEIDAITEEQYTIAVVADGVLVENAKEVTEEMPASSDEAK